MSAIYDIHFEELYNGDIDIVSGSPVFRVALLGDTPSYAPAPGTEEYVSDVLDSGTTASEFSDASYGRVTLSNVGFAGTGSFAVVADDATFSSLSGGTVQGALVYRQVGGDDSTPSDDPLVGYYDGTDYPANADGTNFTADWDDDGSVNSGAFIQY